MNNLFKVAKKLDKMLKPSYKEPLYSEQTAAVPRVAYLQKFCSKMIISIIGTSLQ